MERAEKMTLIVMAMAATAATTLALSMTMPPKQR